ncbi:uncharacterized protein [Clytia hemisphaerica]|uniref:Uncharacterized protein n=1 Tax=Clytia hemisphaerica TaxID=252671 RepID=A0A7M5X707_9CNID
MNKLVLLLLGVSCALIAFTNARAIEDDLNELLELEESREKRQLPPPGGGEGGLDKQLLERLMLEKLNFLKNFGLLKGIPFIGEFVHQLVENDPEGVSKALSGGIFAILDLALKAIAAGALGK